MRRASTFAIAIIASVSACTAATPVIEPTTPLPSATGSPSPTARAKARVPVARWAVYSTGAEIVLYDAKKDAVRTVARGSGLSQPTFVTDTVIAFLQRFQNSPRATLLSLDLTDGTQRELFSDDDGIDVYGVSPDGQRVAYVSRDPQAYPHLRIKTLVGTRATKSVTTLARALGREIQTEDQLAIEFDRDGTSFLMAFTYADGSGDEPEGRSQLQLRGADGTLLFAPPHDSDPTMGVWAAKYKRFYFADDDGVRAYRLRDGRRESVLGEAWYNPSVSRDGDAIAFDTGSGLPRVQIRILDLDKGAVSTVGPKGRFSPVFATSKVVWAQEVIRCEGDCLSKTSPTQRVFRINLTSGKEKQLALTTTQGLDVWYA